MGEPPVGTITLLFTDIEGSTRQARATGAVWQDVLAVHHEAVARAIEDHAGYVEAIQGDGFFAAFADARAAVDAASDAQRALAVSPKQVVQAGDGWLPADGLVSSVMVVVVEPAVKGGGAFLAGGVDGAAVGPAAEHGADEALCFAVG